jgi:thioredoxin reductase
MIRTVDLVVAGDTKPAVAAAADALRRGRRVLVVLRSCDARVGRSVRRELSSVPGAKVGHVTVMTHAEVVCVDGIDGVEAVIIRDTRTRRLSAVNASAFLASDCPDACGCTGSDPP